MIWVMIPKKKEVFKFLFCIRWNISCCIDSIVLFTEKERLALAELAEIEAPEKPSYTNEELDKFVSFIQRITTLSNLQKSDWNDDCFEIIKEYLMEPKNIILCIYFHENILMASLNVPDVDFYDMTYFLRQQPDMIYSIDNFYDEIMFGTIIGSIEGSLLKTLEIVYAPILQSTNLLPNSILLLQYIKFNI